MLYQINKGVGRPLDFFGLKGQYILYFLVGMVLAFISFLLFRMVSEVIGYLVAAVVALCAYCGCHYLNSKYGVDGLSDRFAMNMCPERVSPKKANRLVMKTSRKTNQ